MGISVLSFDVETLKTRLKRISALISRSVCDRLIHLTTLIQRSNQLHSAFGRRHVMRSTYIIGFVSSVLLASAAPSWGTESAVAPGKNTSNTVPLYTNLGSHHKPISTGVPATQQYFDQGLRFVYGFNHAEAIRSF